MDVENRYKSLIFNFTAPPLRSHKTIKIKTQATLCRLFTPSYQNAVFNVSEQELVEQCLNGKRSAWQELYERYKTPLFRLCLRYAASRQEAEDWLQDAFVQAFADLPQYRGGGPLGAWLRKVALNTALQNLRKKKAFFTDTDIATFSDTREAEDVHILADIDAQRLIALMQKLPDGYRTVFNLYVIEGYTHEEIAGLLGIQSGTSKSQLSKAKAMMRNLLTSSALQPPKGELATYSTSSQ